MTEEIETWATGQAVTHTAKGGREGESRAAVWWDERLPSWSLLFKCDKCGAEAFADRHIGFATVVRRLNEDFGWRVETDESGDITSTQCHTCADHPEIELREQPARNGSEQDALSRYWRSQLCWTQRAGATSWVKRSIRRRERQAGKRETRHATSSD